MNKHEIEAPSKVVIETKVLNNLNNTLVKYQRLKDDANYEIGGYKDDIKACEKYIMEYTQDIKQYNLIIDDLKKIIKGEICFGE